jgi:hypothetical protein
VSLLGCVSLLPKVPYGLVHLVLRFLFRLVESFLKLTLGFQFPHSVGKKFPPMAFGHPSVLRESHFVEHNRKGRAGQPVLKVLV